MLFDISLDVSCFLLFFLAGFMGCLGFRLCDWILRVFKDVILELFDRMGD